MQKIGERNLDTWYKLQKDPHDESSKHRGSLHMSARLGTNKPSKSNTRKNYDSLLARLIHHEITTNEKVYNQCTVCI